MRAPHAASAKAERLSGAIAGHEAIAKTDGGWKRWAARAGHLERTLEVALNKPSHSLKSEADIVGALNEAVSTFKIGKGGPRSLQAAIADIQGKLVDARGRPLECDGRVGDHTATALETKRRIAAAPVPAPAAAAPVPATAEPLPPGPAPAAATPPPTPPPAAAEPLAAAPAADAAPLAPPAASGPTPISGDPIPDTGGPRTFHSDEARAYSELFAAREQSPAKFEAARAAFARTWDDPFRSLDAQRNISMNLARDLTKPEIDALPTFIRDSVRDHIVAARFMDAFAANKEAAVAGLQQYYAGAHEDERLRVSRALHTVLGYEQDRALPFELTKRIGEDRWAPQSAAAPVAAHPLSADQSSALQAAIAAAKARDDAKRANTTSADDRSALAYLDAQARAREAYTKLVAAVPTAAQLGDVLRTLPADQAMRPVMGDIVQAWYDSHSKAEIAANFVGLHELANDPVLREQTPWLVALRPK